MKRKLTYLLYMMAAVAFGNCQKLDTLTYLPTLTPESFLESHHWIRVSLGPLTFILDQPTSTFFVYFLSGIYLLAAYIFWKQAENQNSKLYWAVGFLFTGFAAILAGTSYQALGYELKCEAREYCRYTTWFEIHYEVLQNLGMNGFLVAAAHTYTKDKWQKALLCYAILNSFLYSFLVFYGAFSANRFLVSFEFLELSCLPSVVYFLFSSIRGYLQKKDKMNFHLLSTWLILVVIMISYVVYLEYGFTTILWKKGIWFSENDVLHVGLILWVVYILKFLPNQVKDSQ